MSRRDLPTATYRLQLSSRFTFDDATQVCGYLRCLGVDWVYLSPVLQAEPGSDHGYDVIDHHAIDAERGGQDAFERFCVRAHSEGLGVLVDIVPNHMGVATPQLNRWWWDLLEAGRDSRYADAFDVEWDAAQGRIRIPVLGDDVVDGPGELDTLAFDGDAIVYNDVRYPIAEGTKKPGDSAQAVHDRQNYELVNWRRADAELNYRRFFAVNSLAGIRVEDPWVFGESHALIARWFHEGLVDGLRVDHPDGLADPESYLARLATWCADAPVWVEKILEGHEALSTQWATVGTTGYDALGDFDRVLVDERGREGLERAQQQVGASDSNAISWNEMVFASKTDIADGILRSEVNRIARLLPDITGAADALIALLAAFPVYRSYLPRGREYLDEAMVRALTHHPEWEAELTAVAEVLADAAHPAAIQHAGGDGGM